MVCVCLFSRICKQKQHVQVFQVKSQCGLWFSTGCKSCMCTIIMYSDMTLTYFCTCPCTVVYFRHMILSSLILYQLIIHRFVYLLCTCQFQLYNCNTPVLAIRLVKFVFYLCQYLTRWRYVLISGWCVFAIWAGIHKRS